MKRSILQVVTVALFLLALLPVRPCAADGVEGASVAVYNSGRALVSESRTVSLPKGPARVVFKNIPDTLDPTSVSAEAEGMAVTGLEYSRSDITARSLLNRYVGKELSVILPDPASTDGRILRKAVLLSNVDKPVFKVGNEIYLGDALAYLLPQLPEGVEVEPTLALSTDNAVAAKRTIQLRYLMGGLTWRANYIVILDSADKTASLEGWAVVSNTSEFDLTSASLKLVAGEVRQPAAPMMRKTVMLEMSAMGDKNMGQPESFSQYHVYNVPGRTSLAAGVTRQINLLSSPKVDVSEALESRYGNTLQQLTRPVEQAVQLSLHMANIKDKGLGVPLPAGQVRAFRPTRDGSLLLLGETAMPHIGVGREVVLPMGTSFDVSVKRTQTEFTKLGKQSYRIGWTLAVTNGRPMAQPLSLVDSYRGEWQVLNADREHTRPDAANLQFDVTVPPTPDGKPFLINYTVQVTY
ncbi:DUF4139 domain-containing protein [Pseudodesulfovibrio sp.]|uniref:DUF4139 domain-containing protein n=1 Tax=unclassified Pseudodesulfovibrio TaxID=2661612 RepID=UPI003AFF9AC7